LAASMFEFWPKRYFVTISLGDFGLPNTNCPKQ